MRTLTVLTLLAATATASADHQYGGDESWRTTSPTTYLPQNAQPQTEDRYLEGNKLAELRLDAYRQRAYVQLPQYTGALDYLELRAGRRPFMLHDVVVRFADGTSIRTGSRGFVEPHQGRVINLPYRTAPVVGVILHYDASGSSTRWGRGPRVELFGVPEHRRWR
jgi:hypothetical protein